MDQDREGDAAEQARRAIEIALGRIAGDAPQVISRPRGAPPGTPPDGGRAPPE